MAANDLAEQISETTGSLPREWEAPDLDIQESPPTETDEISPAWPSSAKLRPLPVRLRISFSERRRRPLERRSSLETLHEDRPASFSRARPEDEMQVSAYSSQPRGPLKQNSSIQRHQNLEDVFTARDADAAVDQVRDESMILARLETNKIIIDEFTFLQRFAAALSRIYNQPPSSMAITVYHGVCMMYRGGFDAAYSLTISAAPSLVQPLANQANLAPIQGHLAQNLRVPAPRGTVLFAPIAGARCGRDASSGGQSCEAGADKEQQQQQQQQQQQWRRRMMKALSMRRSTPNLGPDLQTPSSPGAVEASGDDSDSQTTSYSDSGSGSDSAAAASHTDGAVKKPAVSRLERKRSFMQLIFQKRGKRGNHVA